MPKSVPGSQFSVLRSHPIKFLGKSTTSQAAEKLSLAAVLKGRGFSRTAKSFCFVIPNRSQPRSRGEDDEESAFFRSLFTRALKGTEKPGL